MDETARGEAQLRARRLRSARMRRMGELRRRTLLFSTLTFIAAWVAVFGQMALGSDPVLTAKRTRPSSATPRSGSDPAPARNASRVVVDPVSGLVERVPVSQSGTALAPASPPVTTAQS